MGTLHTFPSPSRMRNALKGSQNMSSANDGGSDDMWKASVENRLTTLHEDIREVRKNLWVVAFFLLAAFAGGYLALDAKISSSTDKIQSQIDNSLDKIIIKIDGVENNLSRHSNRK